jgi:hypothetical protein
MDVGERDAWLQERYARLVDLLTRIAFLVSAGAFVLYLAGVPMPLMAPDDLPQLWALPLEEYLALSGAPTGWAWLALLGHADYVCLAGLALFPCVILLCNAAVLGALMQRRERLMAVLVAAQVAVLAIAASNLLG